MGQSTVTYEVVITPPRHLSRCRDVRVEAGGLSRREADRIAREINSERVWALDDMAQIRREVR